MRAWCIGPTLRKSGRPQTAHSRRACARLACRDRRVLGDQLEDREIDRFRRRAEDRVVALRLEAADQRADVGEVELGVAPVDGIERAEAVLLDRSDLFLAEAAGLLGQAERAERAVLLVAAGTARDLRHFGNRQAAVAAAVELFQARECDVGDVHVEAHADRVGGDEIIDLAALEHRDLRVAGGGREGAHDDRGAALEAPQHLGERVDLLGGEGDDRRARRQAGELDAAGIAQGREARAADDLGVGQQLADDRLQRVRAEDQSLFAAAGAEHAVGEDVAALRDRCRAAPRRSRRMRSRAEGPRLGGVAARHRHALGGAQEIARLRRDDPLLAGEQRDLLFALHRDDAVVDFAGEQAEREADDAGRMAAHPLDRQVGLAGIGRSEDRPDRSV